MNLYLKKPNKKSRRKTFSIYEQTVNESGCTQNKTVQSSDLAALNESLEKGLIDYITAEKNAKEILKNIKRARNMVAAPSVHNSDNEALLARYWTEKYSKRKLVDKGTARTELERSIRALGNVSLISAEPHEIESAVLSHGWNNNKTRRVLGKIELLLKYQGRNIVLDRPPEEYPNVEYLSEKDFLALLKTVEDRALYTLFYTLFYTGMRLGEAFALSEIKLKEQKGCIQVDLQKDKRGNLRLPKNRKRRQSFVQAKHFKVIREWIKLKDTLTLSRSVINKRFKKIFSSKYTVHDLRHSYAIFLLSKGVSMAHVAQSIGDSEKVCAKYYTGHELVNESIETIKRIVGD